MRPAELVYFPGCPHVAEARERLARAFAEANLTPAWVEYRTNGPDLPDYARGFGSPTILVDGKDVAAGADGAAGAAGGSSDSCRLYVDETGRQSGVPSLRSIVTALNEALVQGP